MGKSALVVAGFSLVAAARSAALATFSDSRLLPDSGLYAAGGFGLFPSPVGRVLGLGGVEALAVAAAGASALLVVLVALLARSWGGSPGLAAGVFVLTPLSWWSVYAGVDALGACLVVAAALALSHGRREVGSALGLGVVLTHLAAAPVVGLMLLRSGSRNERLAAILALALAVCLFAGFTPYGGNLRALALPHRILLVGGLTVLLALVSVAPWLRRLHELAPAPRSLLLAALLGLFLSAGIVGARERVTNTRYALPVVALLCAGAAVKRSAKITPLGDISFAHSADNERVSYSRRGNAYVH